MRRSRGFSLLEIMFALIVVSIGIGVLLTFSASNQHETASKSAGNDYSLIINDVLEQFLSDVNGCNTSPATPDTIISCNHLKGCDSSGNNCSAVTNITVEQYMSLHGITFSDKQKTALKNKGIDIANIKVTLLPSRSDNSST